MALEDLDSPSNYTGRMAEASRRRNPYETTWGAIERERAAREGSARHAASMMALRRRFDPFEAERLEDIQSTFDKDYDLEYRVPIRKAFGRTEQHRDVLAEQDRYFAQEPMREDKERRSFEALRRRYVDPAMIKAEADYQREVARGRAARDVAGITGESRERTAATGAYGDVAGNRVLSGDRAAGAEAAGELAGRMGPAQRTISIGGARGLQAFADANDISLEEAIEYAESQGYTITR
jgi:hypothetical protein